MRANGLPEVFYCDILNMCLSLHTSQTTRWVHGAAAAGAAADAGAGGAAGGHHILRLLLQDVNKRDSVNDTPLCYAGGAGDSDDVGVTTLAAVAAPHGHRHTLVSAARPK